VSIAPDPGNTPERLPSAPGAEPRGQEPSNQVGDADALALGQGFQRRVLPRFEQDLRAVV
jgi:hypothetical protein